MEEYLLLTILSGLGISFAAIFMFAFDLDQNDWRTKLYLLFMLLLGGLGGLSLHYGSVDNSMNLPIIYMVLQGIFLLLGVFHFWFMYKKLFWSNRNPYDAEVDSIIPEFIYTLTTLCFLTVGLLAIYGYLAGFGRVDIYWAICILFIVPFFFMKSYDFLNQLPQKDFSAKWTFTDEAINEYRWKQENEGWINFQVKEKLQRAKVKNNRTAMFRIIAPRDVPLREVYRLAVKVYNKKGPDVLVQDLGFERENADKFWWLFTIKFIWTQPTTWFRKYRYLDPYSSAVTNEILPTDTIVARRMLAKNAVQNKVDLGFFESEDDDIPMGELIEG